MRLFFLLLLTSSFINTVKASYTRLLLHGILDNAELIVRGEIIHLDFDTYDFKIESVLHGRFQSKVITIQQFRDWPCAQRWKRYEVGQQAILCLGQNDNQWKIIGAGNEGELPILDDRIYFLHRKFSRSGELLERYPACSFNLESGLTGIKIYFDLKPKIVEMITDKSILLFQPENSFVNNIIQGVILWNNRTLSLSHDEYLERVINFGC